MADWVWVESPGARLDEEPRVRAIAFGDGYEQRTPDGINNLVQKWTVPFEGVDDAVADEMVAFLRTHGVAGFNYVPLWQTTPLRVKATSWSRTLGSQLKTSNLSVVFEQVFEP